MIRSCFECKNKCCRTGPGPHQKVTVRDYLDSFGYLESYNTQCEYLSEADTCWLWGTKYLPEECRTHICQNRKFSKKELKVINNVVGCECTNCGCEWMICDESAKKWEYTCEVCGRVVVWEKKVIKRGRRK